MTATIEPTQPPLDIPDGFFDEVATLLETEAAEDIADAVITVCTRRGILHPELDEDPADELRTEQVREVFVLLDAVTRAVSDGTLAPNLVSVVDEMDPEMAALWYGFSDEANDPEAAASVATMLDTGTASV